MFKTATFVALEDYEGKQFSKLCTMFKPSSNSEPKSNTYSRKVFFGVVTTAFRASRRMFWGKFFWDKFWFLYHIGDLVNVLLSLGKGIIKVCQNNNLRVQKKNVWKTKIEKSLFCIFGTMIRQTSQKKHDFQNCSISVRAKKFSGKTFLNESFFISFGLWLEKTWKLGKILAGLSE